MLIGEVAEATGVSTKALRFYEDEGLLHEPDRTSGGYRDYRPDVIDRVVFVRQAQAAGLTLRPDCRDSPGPRRRPCALWARRGSRR